MSSRSQSSLMELQRRVRACTAEDRALDNLIGFIVDDEEFCARAAFTDSNIPAEADGDWPAYFTSSVDVALALVDRILPVYAIEINIGPSGSSCDLTWWPSGLTRHWDKVPVAASGVSLPLAILDALLSSLIAETSEPKVVEHG